MYCLTPNSATCWWSLVSGKGYNRSQLEPNTWCIETTCPISVDIRWQTREHRPGSLCQTITHTLQAVMVMNMEIKCVWLTLYIRLSGGSEWCHLNSVKGYNQFECLYETFSEGYGTAYKCNDWLPSKVWKPGCKIQYKTSFFQPICYSCRLLHEAVLRSKEADLKLGVTKWVMRFMQSVYMANWWIWHDWLMQLLQYHMPDILLITSIT